MATQLKNVLVLTGLTVGAPVVTPHLLNVQGRAVIPDFVVPATGGYTITADATNVTVTRTVDGAAAVNVLVEYWNTPSRAFGATNPAPGNQPDGSLTGATPFVLDPAGVAGLGRYAPPEQWFQDNVTAAQPATALGTRVGGNFANIPMIRGGSIVGLSTRFNASVAAGTATVTVTINGVVGTLAVISTAGSNPDGSEVTQDSGIDTFVAGDLVGIQITTDAGFLPITTDLEAWLEIDSN